MNQFQTQRHAVAPLPGFEQIPRVWDTQHNIWLAKIHPGELCVTTAGEAVTAVLGSCVSACVRDTRTGVGGMNHFMLPPGATPGLDADERSAVECMERLVSAVLAHGCGERGRLSIKLVGGSRMTRDTADDSRCTVEFVRRFASSAKLTIMAEDVGGIEGREVVYWPGTGQLRIRKLRGIPALVGEREAAYALSLQAGRRVGTTAGRVG